MDLDQDNTHHLALSVGTRIGDYLIKGILGQGGFSLVYLAWDEALNCNIALKEYIPRQLATRTQGNTVVPHTGKDRQAFDEGLQRFIEEARVLIQLDHPAVVRVMRIVEANHTAYMAMPYYQGETLKTFQTRTAKRWTATELQSFLEPLLDALGLLHRNNLLHRDIAPDNIFIKDNDQPLLIDFGAARRMVGEMTASITLMVKPGYSPIEQYSSMGKIQAGPWSDIYSLAAVAYELASGEKVYLATDRVMYDQMPKLSDRKSQGLNAQLVNAIDRALAVAPKDRPQSIGEWLDMMKGKPLKNRKSSKKIEQNQDNEKPINYKALFITIALLMATAMVGFGVNQMRSTPGITSGSSEQDALVVQTDQAIPEQQPLKSIAHTKAEEHQRSTEEIESENEQLKKKLAAKEQESIDAKKNATVAKAALKIGGKGPGGGIIFFLDNSGEHGLEAKRKDYPQDLDWDTAMATDYGSEWRLPTLDELKQLYEKKIVVGGFANESYWSSTKTVRGEGEYQRGDAEYQFFGDGDQWGYYENESPIRVRAVRAF